MAVSFVLRTQNSSGMATIFARVRSRKLNLDYKIDTLMQVDIAAWKKSQTSADALSKFRKSADGQKLYSKLDLIQDTIDSRLKKGEALAIEQSRKLIEDIIYKEMREEAERQKADEKRKAEEARRMTLNKYIHTYRDEVISGKRMNAHGKAFSISSIKTIKTCIVQFDAFQDFVGKKYNFDDIDLNFRNEFLAFLYTEKKYSTNTAAKCIENLATILGSAVAEGHTKNVKFQDRRFKTSRVEVDSIYLTKKELQAFCNADLSKESPGHEIARDIFMVGVYTAQRVSDYNNISREDIKIADDGSVIINIRQQKTGATVMIPAKPELVAILEKYNYELPHLADQKINDYIKRIGEIAEINELVEVETSKGGVTQKTYTPKHKLIQTHTARRTGATLMYLAGMNVFNICAITGHTSIKMLKKYIKADSLQKAETILSDEAYMKW